VKGGGEDGETERRRDRETVELVSEHAQELTGYLLFFLSVCSKGKHDWFQWWADRFFEVFAVLFGATRIGLYGFVVYSCWDAYFRRFDEFAQVDKENQAWQSCILLSVLLVLQFYWFSLIVAVAVKQQRGGNAEDTRSDSEHDSDEDADDIIEELADDFDFEVDETGFEPENTRAEIER